MILMHLPSLAFTFLCTLYIVHSRNANRGVNIALHNDITSYSMTGTISSIEKNGTIRKASVMLN